MQLLERQSYIESLRGFLGDAAKGQGRLVFVSGEAGIGKTSLIRSFCDEARVRAHVAVASCDALSTPGPLGPIIHIAPALGLPADLMFQPGTTREHLYHSILSTLQQSQEPTVLVGEDAHWADEASLNLLRFLGRRVGDLRALIVITFRDDELGPHHPLWIVLGDLATSAAVRRLPLPRLSVEAVRTMAAGQPVDADAIHMLTGGNPFFVSEVLTARVSGLPASIRDVVLARAARLSPDERRVLDAAAVIGSQVDLDLLSAVVDGDVETEVEACLSAGVIEFRDDAIGFRHELAREAILGAISPLRRVSLHRRVLAILENNPAQRQDLAQLAHHAEAAGNEEAVLRYATLAAEQASTLRAHQQAAAQYARAIRFADRLPAPKRADLLERRSYECYLSGLLDEAIAASERALDLWRETGDLLKQGDRLRWLSRLHWFAGHNAEAERAGREAITTIESLPPGPELARAYSNQAQLRTVARDTDEALMWGERAIALAEQLGETETLVHALNNVGTTRLYLDDESGLELLERSLTLARQHGYEDHVARALANLAWSMILRFRFTEAEQYLAEGVTYSIEHDLDIMRTYLQADWSVLHLRRGEWTVAFDKASEAVHDAASNALTRILAWTVIGLVQARRGEDATEALDEALALAERNGDLIRHLPVRAARAEAAWLSGDAVRAVAEARTVLNEAVQRHHRWFAGDLTLTLARIGERDLSSKGLAEPYALQLHGEWQRAAEIWQTLGCPLEEARALIDGDEEAVRQAWAIFDRLGARLDAAIAIRRLRDLGVRQLPRGPRSITRANPSGLTERELEVLALVVVGASNREIAARLFLSPKTVGHHVSAILGKLDVPSRTAAADAAIKLAIFQDREPPIAT